MGEPITVIKNDHTGREVWRYRGVVLERSPTHVRLEATFNRDDVDLGYAVFRRGDRFVECFYADRWYNLFEVHDVDDDHLKGWYCNFTRPARLSAHEISADDLALDLYVYPDGRALVLDRDEFDALPISAAERAAVLEALDRLQAMIRDGAPPFGGGDRQEASPGT
jgi:predicted RNA-binding protein associated with RNAse of E/G family